MLMINFLIGLLVVVTFALTFLLGIEYGKNRMRKVYSGMLINQHACLNWALQWIFPPLEKKNEPGFELELEKWGNDSDYAESVAEGNIDALLLKE